MNYGRMSRQENITARYSAASTAFDEAMTAPGLTLPMAEKRKEAVREFVEAATAYADDLEANSHCVPAGLRGNIVSAQQLLTD